LKRGNIFWFFFKKEQKGTSNNHAFLTFPAEIARSQAPATPCVASCLAIFTSSGGQFPLFSNILAQFPHRPPS
jgi:hypothetical protein